MIEFDLLFFEKNGGKINSDYFIDMGLESLKQILNDKEYNVFLETVCTPLTVSYTHLTLPTNREV